MDDAAKVAVVTGAFSFTGKYVTKLLLDRGWRVRTLTRHPDRPNPFGDRVEAYPYNFHRPDKLTHAIRGASALVNTYWVRFAYGQATFASAIDQTRVLVDAAVEAGVQRLVHVSIANSSADSPLPYYAGKAETERIVAASGLSYAIVRPTVVFGVGDILINNVAWFVRRFPLFAVPGDGQYRLRPIYVEDLAALIVDRLSSAENSVTDAIGPEVYSFDGLVQQVAGEVGKRPGMVHVPAAAAYLATKVTGWFVGDVVLTWDEYRGLMSNLLMVEGEATGTTRLSAWLADYRQRVGSRYASELARHFRGATEI